MEEGDVLKMGRMTLKIKEMVLSEKEKEDRGKYDVFNSKEVTIEDGDKKKEEHTRLCRICFVEEEDKNNPLVSLCSCAGSMKYIHFDCLRKWLKNKLVGKETKFSFTYKLKNLECELCKTELPGKIPPSSSWILSRALLIFW